MNCSPNLFKSSNSYEKHKQLTFTNAKNSSCVRTTTAIRFKWDAKWCLWTICTPLPPPLQLIEWQIIAMKLPNEINPDYEKLKVGFDLVLLFPFIHNFHSSIFCLSHQYMSCLMPTWFTSPPFGHFNTSITCQKKTSCRKPQTPCAPKNKKKTKYLIEGNSFLIDILEWLVDCHTNTMN